MKAYLACTSCSCISQIIVNDIIVFRENHIKIVQIIKYTLYQDIDVTVDVW